MFSSPEKKSKLTKAFTAHRDALGCSPFQENRVAPTIKDCSAPYTLIILHPRGSVELSFAPTKLSLHYNLNALVLEANRRHTSAKTTKSQISTLLQVKSADFMNTGCSNELSSSPIKSARPTIPDCSSDSTNGHRSARIHKCTNEAAICFHCCKDWRSYKSAIAHCNFNCLHCTEHVTGLRHLRCVSSHPLLD